MEDIYEDYIVNRDFAYIITNSSNVPLFSGIVNNINDYFLGALNNQFNNTEVQNLKNLLNDYLNDNLGKQFTNQEANNLRNLLFAKSGLHSLISHTPPHFTNI